MTNEVVEAPVETLEELAVPAYDAGESAAEPAAADNETQIDETHPRQKGGFQRRIDRLTRDRALAEQERDYWREQELRGHLPAEAQYGYELQEDHAAQHVPQHHPDGKPIPDYFETQADYLEALADWKLEQREKQRDAEQQVRAQYEREQQQFADREHAFRQNSDDYDEVIADAIARETPMSHALWSEVREHDHGPALLYYLAANPEEAERLAHMSPTQVAREVGRLESRFVPSADTPRLSVAANISRAPKPPSPLGRTSTHTSAKDPGEMEPHEYREWRRRQFPNL